jgi:hypothetical protein
VHGALATRRVGIDLKHYAQGTRDAVEDNPGVERTARTTAVRASISLRNTHTDLSTQS